MTLQAEFVERFHDEVAAQPVLLAHHFHVGAAMFERLDGRFLRNDGRAEH